MLGCILGLTAVAVTPGDGLGHGIGGPGLLGCVLGTGWDWCGLAMNFASEGINRTPGGASLGVF